MLCWFTFLAFSDPPDPPCIKYDFYCYMYSLRVLCSEFWNETERKYNCFFSGYCQIDFAESSSSSSPDPFYLGSNNVKSMVVSQEGVNAHNKNKNTMKLKVGVEGGCEKFKISVKIMYFPLVAKNRQSPNTKQIQILSFNSAM